MLGAGDFAGAGAGGTSRPDLDLISALRKAGGCGVGGTGTSDLVADVFDFMVANLNACPMLSLLLRRLEKDFFRRTSRSGAGVNG